MLVIPAIDIKDGACVRLLQGDFRRLTLYDRDPVRVARMWRDKGAQRIHVVDLDGSKDGTPAAGGIIESIAEAVAVPVQVGGGIRTMETVERYFSAGVGSVIVGTMALKDRQFVAEAARRYPGRIILGIDARDSRVAVEGWIEQTEQSPVDIAKQYETCGLEALVYTDISRDGMQTGVNREATEALARAVAVPVIASGGVGSIADIEGLRTVRTPPLMGVIVGKALYDGRIRLEEAIAAARGDEPGTL